MTNVRESTLFYLNYRLREDLDRPWLDDLGGLSDTQGPLDHLTRWMLRV